MFKKAKLYSLLAIIVVSTVVGLFGSANVVSAQEVNPEGFAGQNATTLTKNKIYAQLLHQCLNEYGGRWEKTIDQIREDGNWLASPDNIDGSNTDSDDSGWRAGYIVENPPEDGKLSCHSSRRDGQAIVQGYMDLIGYDDNLLPSEYTDDNGLRIFHFICHLGFRPTTNTSADKDTECVEAAKDDSTKYKLVSNSTSSVSLQPHERYLAYRFTLLESQACNARPTTDLTIDSHTIAMVQEDGSVAQVNYAFPDPGKDVSVFAGNGGYLDDCVDLVDLMNQTHARYAEWVRINEDDPYTSNYDSVISNSTCRIDAIGWLICPVAHFLGSAIDGSYNVMEKFLLRVDPISLDTSDENGLYQSWKIMRDFANIAFVIAFLIIVFSQTTSIGVNNYGIKRTLPRIAIAAIMVNLSYFLCALAVDASNLLGSSLKELLDQHVSERIPLDPSFFGGSATEGAAWAGITTAILGVGVQGLDHFFGTTILSTLLLAALAAIIIVVVILTIRQALIILLIVISPLAFVALLLPNTENYFDRWRKTFQIMLLLYPIVALIFGASALASKIIMAAADHPIVQLLGLGVSIIPLAITPIVMTFAGGMLNRIAGIVNDKEKGLFDRARNSANEAGQVRRARTTAGVGRWVRGKRLDGDGNEIDSPNSSRIFGGANSRRRRLFGAATPYGSNQRTKSRKDELAWAESVSEDAYVNTPAGQEARNAAKNAQLRLQNAQINADSIRIEGSEGMAIQEDATRLEAKKQLAETRSQTEAISALSRGNPGLLGQLKDAEREKQSAENTSKVTALSGANADIAMRAEALAERASTEENKVRQAYEETIAGKPPGEVSSETTKDAIAARRSSNIVNSATDSAKRVSDRAFSGEVVKNDSLAGEMGGIDPSGKSRAGARAATAVDRAETEEVENAVTLIMANSEPHNRLEVAAKELKDANNKGDVVTARAAAKILVNGGSKGNTELDKAIIEIEGKSAQNPEVFRNLKSDLVGSKSTNIARDRWSTSNKLTLKQSQAESDYITALDERELAGQQMNVLEEAVAAKSFQTAENYKLVQSLLSQAGESGPIQLDSKKRQLFENVIANPPPGMAPPPTGTATSTGSSSSGNSTYSGSPAPSSGPVPSNTTTTPSSSGHSPTPAAPVDTGASATPPQASQTSNQTNNQKSGSSSSLFEVAPSETTDAELARMGRNLNKLTQQLETEGRSYTMTEQDRVSIGDEVMRQLTDYGVEQPSTPQAPPSQAPPINKPPDTSPEDV